jgi:hypothetical protein
VSEIDDRDKVAAQTRVGNGFRGERQEMLVLRGELHLQVTEGEDTRV